MRKTRWSSKGECGGSQPAPCLPGKDQQPFVSLRFQWIVVLILGVKPVPGFTSQCQFLGLGRELTSTRAANILVAKPVWPSLSAHNSTSVPGTAGVCSELMCHAGANHGLEQVSGEGFTQPKRPPGKPGNRCEGMAGRDLPNITTERHDERRFPAPWRASTQCSSVPGLGQEPPTSSVLVTTARCRYPAWKDSPLPPRQHRRLLGFISSAGPLKQALY